MEWLKLSVDYGVIGLLAGMSIVAVGIAIERYQLYRQINVDDFTDKRELELEITNKLHITPLPAHCAEDGLVRKSGRGFYRGDDGGVEDLSVLESSGYPVLDRNAVEAVRQSCPMPKPPVRTALIMPIVYRLE